MSPGDEERSEDSVVESGDLRFFVIVSIMIGMGISLGAFAGQREWDLDIYELLNPNKPVQQFLILLFVPAILVFIGALYQIHLSGKEDNYRKYIPAFLTSNHRKYISAFLTSLVILVISWFAGPYLNGWIGYLSNNTTPAWIRLTVTIMTIGGLVWLGMKLPKIAADSIDTEAVESPTPGESSQAVESPTSGENSQAKGILGKITSLLTINLKDYGDNEEEPPPVQLWFLLLSIGATFILVIATVDSSSIEALGMSTGSEEMGDIPPQVEHPFPWHIYAFAALGTVAYLFTNIATNQVKTFTPLQATARFCASFPVAAGVYVLLPSITTLENGLSLPGIMFLAGFAMEVYVQTFNLIARRLFALPEPKKSDAETTRQDSPPTEGAGGTETSGEEESANPTRV